MSLGINLGCYASSGFNLEGARVTVQYKENGNALSSPGYTISS
jgi:hypothetical protein